MMEILSVKTAITPVLGPNLFRVFGASWPISHAAEVHPSEEGFLRSADINFGGAGVHVHLTSCSVRQFQLESDDESGVNPPVPD